MPGVFILSGRQVESQATVANFIEVITHENHLFRKYALAFPSTVLCIATAALQCSAWQNSVELTTRRILR